MMARPIRFLAVDDVLQFHAIAIRDQGGDPSIRDRGLLESAVAIAQQQFGGEYLHPDIPSMAAVYAFHICKNHPFVDGNKRAATAAMIFFLIDNGWSFDSEIDESERVILDLAASSIEKTEFTTWLKRKCHEKPSIELRDFLARLTLHEVDRWVDAAMQDNEAGFKKTIDEARATIPLVDAMWSRLESLIQQGTGQADLRGELANIRLLNALFRIAEDMGYEW